MKNTTLKIPILILSLSLLFAFALVWFSAPFQGNPTQVTCAPTISSPKLSPFAQVLDDAALFSRQIIPDRLNQFLQLLNTRQAQLKNLQDFYLKTKDWTFRRQLALQTGIEESWILVHTELADLLQTGMHPIDAQMLHFAHWNTRCPFSHRVINLDLLAQADSEKILMTLQGWQAGNRDPEVERYKIFHTHIQQWIRAAQQQPTTPISYCHHEHSSVHQNPIP
ncbi:MAG: hypothetical protein AAGD05_09775 [Bacteroidota bacterium]